MSDYIPKVGDKVECISVGGTGEVLFVGSSYAFIKCTDGFERSIRFNNIRPIKSARDKAIDEMLLDTASLGEAGLFQTLYDLGYRKVNPISIAEYEDTCRGASTCQDDYKKLVELGHIVSE